MKKKAFLHLSFVNNLTLINLFQNILLALKVNRSGGILNVRILLNRNIFFIELL